MDAALLEKLIIKGCCIDQNYTATLSSIFQKDYFDNQTASRIFDFIINHFNEYKNLPPRSVIVSEYDVDGSRDVAEFFGEIDSVDFDYIQNYDYLFNSTNDYMKEKALKNALLASVDIINKKEELALVRKHIEDALSKDLRIDLGLDYFGTLRERLTRIMNSSEVRIPSGFPILDEYISGGFPPYTLSIITARIHGFKSTFLANMAARQVLKGYNVVLASLEMSEDAFAQRFDSIFSLLDINRIYRDKATQIKLVRSLDGVKNKEGRGNLYIKQYPTGRATVNEYRKYLRELSIRGIKIDAFICDYLNLMKPMYKTKGDMYSDIKTIAEELRALSFEFQVPVISVSQLNREGMRVSFDEVDFTYVSESTGVAATADFMAIFGSDEDKAVYESELFYKLVKNRLGGRVGMIDKFYIDNRSLKMYDSSEMEIWMNDAMISNDTRKMAEAQPDPIQRNRGQRSQRR